MSNELRNKMEEYFEFFKDSFPLMELNLNSDEKMIEIIDNCIKEEKDVYDMGYCDVNAIY